MTIDEMLTIAQHHPAQPVKLLGPRGDVVELPASVTTLLRQLITHLAHGNALTLVPVGEELTTQQAADILNVSRPYLIKLLETAHIPYSRVGRHRRIRFADLMRYKSQRNAELRAGLDALSRLSQELGDYD
ncbi:MAG: helix-turn-helix domain-containing protein [Ktedonobacterales bacterium]